MLLMRSSSEEAHAGGDALCVLFNAQSPVLLDNSSLLRQEKPEANCSPEEGIGETVGERDISDVLQRTSQAIRDIDALVTAAMQTSQRS